MMQLSGELAAAFGAAGVDYAAATNGCHACTETMTTRAY